MAAAAAQTGAELAAAAGPAVALQAGSDARLAKLTSEAVVRLAEIVRVLQVVLSLERWVQRRG